MAVAPLEKGPLADFLINSNRGLHTDDMVQDWLVHIITSQVLLNVLIGYKKYIHSYLKAAVPKGLSVWTLFFTNIRAGALRDVDEQEGPGHCTVHTDQTCDFVK